MRFKPIKQNVYKDVLPFCLPIHHLSSRARSSYRRLVGYSLKYMSALCCVSCMYSTCLTASCYTCTLNLSCDHVTSALTCAHVLFFMGNPTSIVYLSPRRDFLPTLYKWLTERIMYFIHIYIYIFMYIYIYIYNVCYIVHTQLYPYFVKKTRSSITLTVNMLH